MNLKRILPIVLLCLLSSQSMAQELYGRMRRPIMELKIQKTGPYFGLQQGRYSVLEIGVERIWKKARLMKAKSQAINTGFNYNFRHNILGYDIGYWYKPNRIGLTYGGMLFLRTNFTETLVGIAPAIGFKFWLAHLQTGYHFMSPLPSTGFQTNRFFVSLRIGLINDRDVDLEWGWKKKGKKKS